MTEQHPITPPPPELVREWNEAAIGTHFPPYGYSEYIATEAARWGADQELEACCEWLDQNTGRWDLLAELRTARRPQAPSLAEEALKALDHLCVNHPKATYQEKTILRAIKRLQELENNG